MSLVIFVMLVMLAGCAMTDTFITNPNVSHTHVVINNLAQWSVTHIINTSYHYLQTSGSIVGPRQSGSWFLSGRRNGHTLTNHTATWTIPSWLYASGLHRIIQSNDRLLATRNDDSQRKLASTQQTLNRRNRPITTQMLYTFISSSGYKVIGTTGIWGGREEGPCMIQFANDQRKLACTHDTRHLTLTRNSGKKAIIAGSGLRNERFVHDIIGSRTTKNSQTKLTIKGLLRIPGLSLSVPIMMVQTTKKQETDDQEILVPHSRDPKPRRLRDQIHRHTP